jgi:hypothetical protein
MVGSCGIEMVGSCGIEMVGSCGIEMVGGCGIKLIWDSERTWNVVEWRWLSRLLCFVTSVSYESCELEMVRWLGWLYP